MPIQELIDSFQRLSADELETLLQKRQAEDKALRALWRAAVAREREERRQRRELPLWRRASEIRKGMASA